MRNVVLTSLALLLILAFTASAYDFNGKYVAQVPGRQGNMMEQTFAFKVEGAKVTGTISSQRGDQEITEGQTSGDDISFVVIRKFNDMEMKSSYKGKGAASEIKFVVTMAPPPGGDARPPVEFTAKKAN